MATRLHGNGTAVYHSPGSLLPTRRMSFHTGCPSDRAVALPRSPRMGIGQALTFFRKVFEDLQSEAYLHLFFSRKSDQFRLWCPRQKVSRGGVEYDGCDQMGYEERTGRKPGEPCGEAVW